MASPGQGTTFSQTDRIRTLSKLSNTIPAILTSAGTALQNLSPSQPQSLPPHIHDLAPAQDNEAGSSDSDDEDQPLAEPPNPSATNYDNKMAFQSSAKAYISLVLSLQNALHEHVIALGEEGILSVAPGSTNTRKGDNGQGETGKDGDNIVNKRVTVSDLGNLDVGYLNERSKDTGRAYEAELLVDVKQALEDLARRNDDQNSNTQGIDTNEMDLS
jgi:hypothetical protein